MIPSIKYLAKRALGEDVVFSIRKSLDSLISLKHNYELNSYRRITDSDFETFKPVLSVWQPPNKEPVFLLNWSITQWCNYKCPYCPQSHDRFGHIGKYAAHAFDNHPLEKWLEAFSHHFQKRRLSLVITGGEPMLDVKNMAPFLKGVASMSTVECIRIDTNASWKLDDYKEVDPSKIILMCSYHPSHVSQMTFKNKLKKLVDFGFKIGMVNLVITKDNLKMYWELKKELSEIGIPLHPGPLWYSDENCCEDILMFFKKELPEADFKFRAKKISPYKKKCLFPALAYQMNQFGELHIGCYPTVHGSLFDNDLIKTFTGPVPCPKNECSCLFQYSFLGEVNRNISLNPLLVLSDILKNRI